MTKVQVPPGYHCPFCPNHQDKGFMTFPLFDQPICQGCAIELDAYADGSGSPDDRQIRLAEQLSGLTWRECRIILVTRQLEFWEPLHRDQSGPWFDAMRHWPKEKSVQYVADQVERMRRVLAELKDSPTAAEEGTPARQRRNH